MTLKYNENDEMIVFLGSYLSNFYQCEINYIRPFHSSEQLFMYLKAEYFNDIEIMDKILKCDTPREAKALGRMIRGYNDNWNFVRFDFMKIANVLKFVQNKDLADKLISTGDKILVEGNPIDNIWGVGINWNDFRIFDKSNWRGQNLLGKCLMEVRNDLLRR